LEDIQFRQKNAQSPEEKAAVSQEMMALYKENNISMTGGVGCLPILIQMPIFTAMYQAVNLTPEISASTFLGINLGVSSPLLAILAGVAYVIQGYVSTIGMPQETKSQMKSMMLMNPIMILMFSWSSPAGLALYWLAGGIFAAAQTALQNHMIKPKIQKQVEEEMKDRPVKKNVKMAKPASSSAPAQAVKALSSNNQQTDGKKGRNAGKQSKS
jgi:YidC/Oxa1 family membrane protein insertase